MKAQIEKAGEGIKDGSIKIDLGSGVFEQVMRTLITDVKERGGLDLPECFIDETFVVAKKGAACCAAIVDAGRSSAWLQNFRRIHTRHERILENYFAFVLLGCIIIFLRTRL